MSTIFPELKIEKDKILVSFKKESEFDRNLNSFLKSKKPIIKITKSVGFQAYKAMSGSDFKFLYHPLRIMEYCDEKYDEAKHVLQNPQYFKKLFYRYGTEVEKITYQAYEFWNQTKNIKKTWLMAEIWYVVNYEQCTSVEAFFYRHTEEWMNGESSNNELVKSVFEELTNKK